MAALAETEKVREDEIRDLDLRMVRWIWPELGRFDPVTERLCRLPRTQLPGAAVAAAVAALIACATSAIDLTAALPFPQVTRLAPHRASCMVRAMNTCIAQVCDVCVSEPRNAAPPRHDHEVRL